MLLINHIVSRSTSGLNVLPTLQPAWTNKFIYVCLNDSYLHDWWLFYTILNINELSHTPRMQSRILSLVSLCSDYWLFSFSLNSLCLGGWFGVTSPLFAALHVCPATYSARRKAPALAGRHQESERQGWGSLLWLSCQSCTFHSALSKILSLVLN